VQSRENSSDFVFACADAGFVCTVELGSGSRGESKEADMGGAQTLVQGRMCHWDYSSSDPELNMMFSQ
jgi:hypothetical protein